MDGMEHAAMGVRTPARSGGAALRVLALALSAVAVCTAAATIRVIPFGRAFWDFLFILDGAYRIEVGQVPHLDFMMPIGSLTPYLAYAAERLFPGGQPFVGMHALMWLLMLPPLAMLAPRFESSARFGAAAALLALMVLVPFTVDRTNLSEISYFASYNRFVAGLFFLLGLWYVLPKSRWDAPMLGTLVGLLLLLKVTAAAAAVGVLVAACVLRRAQWRQVGLGLAGLAVACAAVDAATGFFSAYGRDILFMVRVNRGQGAYALGFAAFRNWAPLAAGAGIAVLALRELTRRHAPALTPATVWQRLQTQAFAVDLLLLLGVALAVESQNTGGVGLVAAAALLFHPDIARQGRQRLIATTLFGAALLLPILDVAVFRSVTITQRERAGSSDHGFSAMTPGIRVPSPTLAGAELIRRLSHEWLDMISDVQRRRWSVDNDPSSNAPAATVAWAEDVVDAARAFQAQGLAKTARRYAVLAFTDQFSRLLGLTPVRGTMLAVQVGRTIPPFDAASASRYLAEADGAFLSTCVLSVGGEPTIRMIFQPVLDAEFEAHKLNACWTFYSRRVAVAASPRAEPSMRAVPGIPTPADGTASP